MCRIKLLGHHRRGKTAPSAKQGGGSRYSSAAVTLFITIFLFSLLFFKTNLRKIGYLDVRKLTHVIIVMIIIIVICINIVLIILYIWRGRAGHVIENAFSTSP